MLNLRHFLWQCNRKHLGSIPALTVKASTLSVVERESDRKAYASIPGPKRYPIIGNLHLFSRFGPYSFERLYDAYADLHKKYGPLVRLDIGIKMLLLFSPEDIRKVFYLHDRYPIRPSFEALRHYRLKKSDVYNSGGLVAENGEEWWRLRKACSFIMHNSFAQQYFSSQEKVADDFISRIRHILDTQGPIPDFAQELYRYTEEAIGLVCFGKRIGLLSHSGEEAEFSTTLSKAADESMQAMADTLLSFPWWKVYPTKAYKKLVRSQDFFQSFAEKCVQEAELKLKDPLYKDNKDLVFLRRLFEDETLKRSDVNLLMNEIFSSGIDATGNTIGFLLYNLARKPEVQEKLYQNIEKHSRDGLNVESVSKMVYLRACITESHRLTPASGGIARVLQESIVFSGYRIPEKVLCVGLHPIICRQKRYFKEPLDFRPERWLDDDQVKYYPHRHDAFCVLPFSHGVRRCVGQRFALQEIRLCIIKILQNFRVEYDGPDIGTRMRLSLVPDKPLGFRFVKR